ncbi:MAG TPA: flavin reductase family protein [Saprospiraceae bacterium]|nr:flavin reductase family protein [Saprospiraceae bacterium]
MFKTFEPGPTPQRDFYQFLIGCVGPRPIAFVSTLSPAGVPNLAPYSFFNAFSSNPPIVVFSSGLRAKDQTAKDTLNNVRVHGEVVINMVNHAIVNQMAIASVEFPPEVDEFKKSGLTPLASTWVKPYRVAESPASLECRVQEIIPLGSAGGAGHLVVCRVLGIHIREDIVGDNDRIDPHKMDLMGRLGRSYYVRASGAAVHTIVQPILQQVVGFDAIPDEFRTSSILTGNDLAHFAGLSFIPSSDDVEKHVQEDPLWQQLHQVEDRGEEAHRYLRHLVHTGRTEHAWHLMFG